MSKNLYCNISTQNPKHPTFEQLPESTGGAHWVHVRNNDGLISYIDLHVTNTGDIVDDICSGINKIGLLSHITQEVVIFQEFKTLTKREQEHIEYLAKFCKYDRREDINNSDEFYGKPYQETL